MGSHVGKCIESVRMQDVAVQHIIVDGGSTDDTLGVIEQLKHPNLTVISEGDNGQTQAINKGLKMATGRFFNWLNADDRLMSNSLKKVVDLMRPEVNIILGKCNHVNLDTGQIEQIGQTYFDGDLDTSLANYAMAQPSHFYRTSFVLNLAGLNERLHYVMDMDLWFRYLLKFGTEGIVKTENVLSQFTLHQNAKSSALSHEMSREKYLIFLSVLEQLGAPEYLLNLVKEKARPGNLAYDTDSISANKFVSSFSWHLLLEAYDSGNLNLASKLFNLVKKDNRLSAGEIAAWNLRVNGTTGKVIQTLRKK